MGDIAIGQRFGKLVVESEVPRKLWPDPRHKVYLCRCDCGTDKHPVRGEHLISRGQNATGCPECARKARFGRPPGKPKGKPAIDPIVFAKLVRRLKEIDPRLKPGRPRKTGEKTTTMASIATELGIAESTAWQWLARFRKDGFPDA